MADATLTPAEQRELLQGLGQILPAAILDPWEEAHFTYAEVAEASTMELTVVRADGSSQRLNPPYRAIRVIRDLRSGMSQAGRGTWFTARYSVEPSGEYQVEFDYDHEPSFDFAVPDESYARDLERFPRNQEHTPDWLQAKLFQAAR